MYDQEGDSAHLPPLQAPELQVPMPEHLVDSNADPAAEQHLSMEQGQITPEEAGFGPLAEVIEEAQDVHHQVANDLDWPQQEAA